MQVFFPLTARFLLHALLYFGGLSLCLLQKRNPNFVTVCVHAIPSNRVFLFARIKCFTSFYTFLLLFFCDLVSPLGSFGRFNTNNSCKGIFASKKPLDSDWDDGPKTLLHQRMDSCLEKQQYVTLLFVCLKYSVTLNRNLFPFHI